MKRKILAMLLALALCLGILPPGVLAAEEPISITDNDGLFAAINQGKEGQIYRLDADLTLSGFDWLFAMDAEAVFDATLDGNGHVITMEGSYNPQLVMNLGVHGVIRNLGIAGTFSTATSHAPLVRDCYGTVRNCYSLVAVSSSAGYNRSGLVSYMHDGATVSNCYVAGSLSTSNEKKGAFALSAEAGVTIENCCYLDSLPRPIAEDAGASVTNCVAYARAAFTDGTVVDMLNGNLRTGDLKWVKGQDGMPCLGEPGDENPEEPADVTALYKAPDGTETVIDTQTGLSLGVTAIEESGFGGTVALQNYGGDYIWLSGQPNSYTDYPFRIMKDTGDIYVDGTGQGEIFAYVPSSDPTGHGDLIAHFPVSVTAPADAELRLLCGGEVVSGQTLTVAGSDSLTFTAQIKKEDGSWQEIPAYLLTFTADSNQVYILDSGECWALAPGTYTVKASGFNGETSVSFTSTFVPVESITPAVSGQWLMHERNMNSATGSDFLPVGNSNTNVHISPDNASYRERFTVSSSDNAVAEYQADFLRAVLPKKPGTVTLTATATGPNDTATGTSTLTLAYLNPVTALSMERNVLEVGVGETIDLPMTMTGPKSSEGYHVSEAGMVWTFSQDGVASIDRDSACIRRDGGDSHLEVYTSNDQYRLTGLTEGIVHVTGESVDRSGSADSVQFTVKVGAAQPESANVSFTVQAAGAYLCAPQREVNVGSLLAENYGYTDRVEGVSALDVLVAAHLAVYGDDFTAETAKEYLEVSSGGWVSNALGLGSSLCFTVNGGTPHDDVMTDYGYTGYTIDQTPIQEGDRVEFMFYQDLTSYLDHYVWFEQEGQKAETLTGKSGAELALTLRGYSICYYGCYDEATIEKATAPVAGAQLAWVDPKTGSLTDISGAVTDEDGAVKLPLPEMPGTYALSAWVSADEDEIPCFLPLQTVEVTESWDGAGTEENPYLLKTAGDFDALNARVDGGETFSGCFFRMENDVTLNEGWDSIGRCRVELQSAWGGAVVPSTKEFVPFAGTFDGGGHTLTVPKNAGPLFDCVRNCTIENLKLYGAYIADDGLIANYAQDSTNPTAIITNVTILSGTRIAGSGFLGGYASGSNTVTIRDCHIEAGVTIGCDADGNSLNQDRIGGFGGDFNGTVENSTCAATVYGKDFVGGILGGKGQSLGKCAVTNSCFTGRVEASGNYAGGIVGSGYTGSGWGFSNNAGCVSVCNCYVSGSVTGANYVGGIQGADPGVVQCWANGTGTVTDNLFYGTLTATTEEAPVYVGGIVGYLKGIDRYNVIEGNYYLNTAAERGLGGVGTVDRTEKYGRDDDPMGADAEKLAKAVTAGELTDGTVLNLLNGSKTGLKNWVQGRNHPIFDGQVQSFQVTFTLLGDTCHGSPEGFDDTHTYYDHNLTAWIPEITCTVEETTTVLELLEKLLPEYGMELTLKQSSFGGAYVSGITYNGQSLFEFDNGPSSGWMFLVNGVHGNLSVSQQKLEPDDQVVFHYTDDYSREFDGAAEDRAAADRVMALIDGIGEVSVDSKEAIETARSAYDALRECQKVLVSNYQLLLDAEAAFAELRSLPFTDVHPDDWFYNNVVFAYRKGLMSGTSATTFAPREGLSRAMLVTILYRMAGSPAVTGSVPFPDVKAGRYYTDAVIWAFQAGVAAGDSEGTFRPGDLVTRAEMVTFLYRYAKLDGRDVTTTGGLSAFRDAAMVPGYAKTAMLWAVERGIVHGAAQDTLDPRSTSQRAQMAAILQRYLGQRT